MIPSLEGLPREERRAAIRKLERDNAKWPVRMKRVPEAMLPAPPPDWIPPIECWRSRDFYAQVFDEGGVYRITVCRLAVDSTLRWRDDISWDDLQRIKNEVGYADKEAVEIYPPFNSVVNDANMRHLWVLPTRMPFSWGNKHG